MNAAAPLALAASQILGGSMTYRAPVADIAFTLNHIAGFSKLIERGLFEDLDMDTAMAVLEEAARFANEELAPTNRAGDTQGARLVNGEVVMPEGVTEAYRKWVAAGWGSLPVPKEFGGQGLPLSLSMAVTEMWNSANMAFGLNPLLTQAGVHAIIAHGSPELQKKYLPKLVSGEWTGSMQLTEPHAGSDLRFLKTRATPAGDGSYRVTGTKIFITYGEHPMTDNIIHMVLARLPDAPPGTKGISLFLIPKFLVNDDGSLGSRNDVYAAKLEHKLGIHGSPTAVLNYGDKGGAVGWMVGEPNGGLKAMLTMMIEARIGVGIQGVAIAERAFQQALAYAQDRKQGAADGGAPDSSVAIAGHPDVKRMLLNMKVKTSAARAICYATAVAMDIAHHSPDAAERGRAMAEAALLTPVAKAFSTDAGVDVASEGIQVHGGMGFIEETGAAQHYRDARIAPIYEGTNGIQAIDLVTRKLPSNGGETLRAFIAELKETVRAIKASNEPAFGHMGERMEASVAALEETGGWLLGKLAGDKSAVLAGATPFGRLFGITAGGIYLAKGALAAVRAAGGDEALARAHAVEARHFAESLMGETEGLKHAVTHGHETIEQADAALRGQAR
jgi:alkylation response protein AidB-like acyl-CoA dehydrogenase